MTTMVGIDSGKKDALALVSPAVELLDFADMPFGPGGLKAGSPSTHRCSPTWSIGGTHSIRQEWREGCGSFGGQSPLARLGGPLRPRE
jgi:hypothetical protein